MKTEIWSLFFKAIDLQKCTIIIIVIAFRKKAFFILFLIIFTTFFTFVNFYSFSPTFFSFLCKNLNLFFTMWSLFPLLRIFLIFAHLLPILLKSMRSLSSSSKVHSLWLSYAEIWFYHLSIQCFGLINFPLVFKKIALLIWIHFSPNYSQYFWIMRSSSLLNLYYFSLLTKHNAWNRINK